MHTNLSRFFNINGGMYMPTFLLIALAGAVGAALRFSVSLLFDSSSSHAFPFATLLVNLVGCFLLAFFMAFVSKKQLSERVQTAIATGFIGSFTTFATFSAEVVTLFQAKAMLAAFIYIVISGVGGFLLVVAGYVVGQRMHSGGGAP